MQRDSANVASPTTIVCPLVDARGAGGNLLNVLIEQGAGGTTKASLAVCNQVRVVARERLLGEPLGMLNDPTMDLISAGLRAILDL